MNSCYFFDHKTINFLSRELTSDMQRHGASKKEIYWCNHKHAPADEMISESLLDGGRTLLSCGGDFDKCTISPEKFHDVMPD